MDPATREDVVWRPPHYHTKDVLTSPPTPVTIVRSPQPGAPPTTATPHSGHSAFIVHDRDIEPTLGWESAQRGRTGLTICVSHGFGRCTGSRNGDEATCTQIHVSRGVLQALRRGYANHIRPVLARTLKTSVPSFFNNLLSRLTLSQRACPPHANGEPVISALQYLEFRCCDLEPSRGRQAYDDGFRAWVLGTQNTDSPAAATTAAVPSTVHHGGGPCRSYAALCDLCIHFATHGTCVNGPACDKIHARWTHMIAKDPLVQEAVRQVMAAAQLIVAVQLPCVTGSPLRRGLDDDHGHGGIVFAQHVVGLPPAPRTDHSDPRLPLSTYQFIGTTAPLLPTTSPHCHTISTSQPSPLAPNPFCHIVFSSGTATKCHAGDGPTQSYPAGDAGRLQLASDHVWWSPAVWTGPTTPPLSQPHTFGAVGESHASPPETRSDHRAPLSQLGNGRAAQKRQKHEAPPSRLDGAQGWDGHGKRPALVTG